MTSVGRLAVTISLLAALLLRTSISDAYVISITGTPVTSGENLSVSTSASRISLNDYFNQYDQTRWEIASVQEDETGGISVEYNFPEYGNWDSYGAFANIEFQILAETGDLTPQPVEVDIWGSSFYDHRLFGACCFSESPHVDIYGPDTILSYDAPRSYNTLSSSHVLLSNTSYYLNYSNTQYVEGTPLPSSLPEYFSSRDQYEAFIASRGTAGVVYASAWGFLDLHLAVRPNSVPEPGTFGLFGCALLGFVLARRHAFRRPS